MLGAFDMDTQSMIPWSCLQPLGNTWLTAKRKAAWWSGLHKGCEKGPLSIRSDLDSKALHNPLSKGTVRPCPWPYTPLPKVPSFFLPMESTLLPSASQEDLLALTSSLEETEKQPLPQAKEPDQDSLHPPPRTPTHSFRRGSPGLGAAEPASLIPQCRIG